MNRKIVLWCLFFTMCLWTGYMSAGWLKPMYFDYLENKFEKWQENSTLEKISPYGDRVCLISFERGGGLIEVRYYANCPLMAEGKKIPYDAEIAQNTEKLLRLRFSPSPNVRYREAGDWEYISKVVRAKNEDY